MYKWAGFWQKATEVFAGKSPQGSSGGYQGLIRNNAHALGFCLLFTALSSCGQTFFLSLFQPGWAKALSLSPGQMGAIYAGATLASGLLLPFGGRWLDRTTPDRAALGIIIGLIFFTFLAGMVTHVWMLAIALFGLRFFGQGMSTNLGLTAAIWSFDQNRGKALSVAALGFPLGEAVFPILVTVLLFYLGVLPTWWIISLLLLFVALPVVRRLAAHVDSPARELASQQVGMQPASVPSGKGILSDSRFYLMLAIVMPLPFISTGLIFFQSILAEGRNWSPALFPTGFMVFAVIRALVSIKAGTWVDRWGAVRLVVIPELILALGLVLLLHPSHLMTYLFFICLGASFGFSAPLTTAAWAELFGKERIGLVRGLSSSVAVFTTAAAPLLLGWAIESGLTMEIIIFILCLIIITLSWTASLVLRARTIPRGGAVNQGRV